MSASPLEIGPFHAGEIPPDLVVIFKDAAGAPVNFSAGGPWVAKFSFRSYGGAWQVKSLTAPTANDGTTRYVWAAADNAAPGDYEGEVWVGNNNGARFDSQRIVWQTKPATVPVPSGL